MPSLRADCRISAAPLHIQADMVPQIIFGCPVFDLQGPLRNNLRVNPFDGKQTAKFKLAW